MLDVAAGGSHGRGLTEGDDLIRTLIRLQRQQTRSILLVPQVFVWSKDPDTRGKGSFDFVLGPREWPSAIRTVGQFLYNYKHVALKVRCSTCRRSSARRARSVTPTRRACVA